MRITSLPDAINKLVATLFAFWDCFKHAARTHVPFFHSMHPIHPRPMWHGHIVLSVKVKGEEKSKKQKRKRIRERERERERERKEKCTIDLPFAWVSLCSLLLSPQVTLLQVVKVTQQVSHFNQKPVQKHSSLDLNPSMSSKMCVSPLSLFLSFFLSYVILFPSTVFSFHHHTSNEQLSTWTEWKLSCGSCAQRKFLYNKSREWERERERVSERERERKREAERSRGREMQEADESKVHWFDTGHPLSGPVTGNISQNQS